MSKPVSIGYDPVEYREHLLAGVHRDWQRLAYMKPPYDEDEEIVLAAIRTNVDAIHHVAPRLLAREDWVLKLLEAQPTLSKRVRQLAVKHEGFMRVAVRRYPDDFIDKTPLSLRSDVRFMAEMTAMDSDWFWKVPERLRTSRAFFKAAVLQKGSLMCLAPRDLRDDDELTWLAVTNDPHAIRCATRRRRDSLALAMQAVTKDGMALQWLQHGPLDDNHTLVSTAVKQCAMALQFASKRLCDDPQIALDALTASRDRESGMALQFVSPRLRAEKGLVAAAIKHSQAGRAFQFAAEHLKRDSEFVDMAVRKLDGLAVLSSVPSSIDGFAKLVCLVCYKDRVNDPAWVSTYGCIALLRRVDDFSVLSIDDLRELEVGVDSMRAPTGGVRGNFPIDKLMNDFHDRMVDDTVRVILTRILVHVCYDDCLQRAHGALFGREHHDRFIGRMILEAGRSRYDPTEFRSISTFYDWRVCEERGFGAVYRLPIQWARWAMVGLVDVHALSTPAELAKEVFLKLPEHLRCHNALMQEPRRLALYGLGKRLPAELVQRIVTESQLWKEDGDELLQEPEAEEEEGEEAVE